MGGKHGEELHVGADSLLHVFKAAVSCHSWRSLGHWRRHRRCLRRQLEFLNVLCCMWLLLWRRQLAHWKGQSARKSTALQRLHAIWLRPGAGVALAGGRRRCWGAGGAVAAGRLAPGGTRGLALTGVGLAALAAA